MRSVARLCAALPFVVAACAPKGETAVNDSAATAAAPVVDVAAVRSALEATNAKLAAAFESGDTATLLANYDNDAVVMMSGQPAWRGKSEIATSGSSDAIAARTSAASPIGSIPVATTSAIGFRWAIRHGMKIAA